MRILIAEDEVATVKALGRRSDSYTELTKKIGNIELDSNRHQVRSDKGIYRRSCAHCY